MKVFLIISALGLAFSIPSDSVRKKHYNINSSSLACEGYDPVEYRNAKKATEGKSSFAYTWHGIKYYFKNQANQNTFKSNPEIYEPAYGGWCAYAMGNTGEKVSVDPETFKVINGKTYLFYNSFFNNTKDDWNKAENALKTKADAQWKKIIQ